MTKLFLRYQLRNKQAFFFLIILILFGIRQKGLVEAPSNPYLYAFLISNYLFVNIISQCRIPLPLLYITNAKMVTVVRAFNLSILIWLNLTDGIIDLYNLFVLHIPILICIKVLINLNATIFIAFVTGNRISFSDLYTMKSRTWSSMAASFLFIAMVIPVSLLLSFLNNTWPVTIYFSLFTLLLFITLWWFDSKRYKQINQFSHFIAGYDNDKADQ